MNVNDISRFMNLYMMNSIMTSGMSGTSGISGENNSYGIGSSGIGSSSSVLFQYMLESAINNISNENSTYCRYCGHNQLDIGNNININNAINNGTSSNNKVTLNTQSNSEVYGVYGDFYPMGKAPNLSSRDINIAPRIETAIKEASAKYGVEESFVKAMIKQESSFNPNCTSSAGAKGLMQLMDYNSKDYGVKNPYNIEDNINGGVKYIKDLLDKFDGNKQLALSAYNGGITRMRNRGVDTVPEIVKMPKETRDYVSKVMGYYNQYSKIQNV